MGRGAVGCLGCRNLQRRAIERSGSCLVPASGVYHEPSQFKCALYCTLRAGKQVIPINVVHLRKRAPSWLCPGNTCISLFWPACSNIQSYNLSLTPNSMTVKWLHILHWFNMGRGVGYMTHFSISEGRFVRFYETVFILSNKNQHDRQYFQVKYMGL